MNFPLQENLETATNAGGSKIRCSKCLYVYCEVGEDWRKTAVVKRFPPTSESSDEGLCGSAITGAILLSIMRSLARDKNDREDGAWLN